MRRHALRMRHLQCSIDNFEQLRSLFERCTFLELASLADMQLGSKHKRRLGEWDCECRLALQKLCRPGRSLYNCSSAKASYRDLVESRSEDFLRRTCDATKNTRFNCLRPISFSPGAIDNHQRSLTWICYGESLPVWDMVYRHSCINTGPTFPTCGLIDVTVLHTFVQCPTISDLWAYKKPLLSCVERIQLSGETIINISPPFSSNRKCQAVFIVLVALVRDCL